MLSRKNIFKKTMIAGAIASGVALPGAAQAQQVITWDPGNPTVAATGIAFGTPFDGTAVQTDRINMVAVNDGLGGAGTCAGTNFSCWNFNFDSAGVLTLETFTFLVQDTELSGNLGAARSFGADGLTNNANPGPYTQSYVSVQATLTGQLTGGATAVANILANVGDTTAIADQLALSYDAGSTFVYEFHDDFDASNAGTNIGTFEVVNGGADVGISDNRIELGWNTVATDLPVAGVWADKNGNPFDPITDLLNDITQNVEIVSASSDGAGGATVQIRSRGALIGFSTFPSVPEPGTLALFGIGLIGVGFAARRRSTKLARA